MTRYRKKPVVIDALEWTGKNIAELAKWAAHVDFASKRRRGVAITSNDQRLPIDMISRGDGTCDLEIHTLEGTHRASVGDWVICGVHGEFYPCKPDIFEATYEKA